MTNRVLKMDARSIRSRELYRRPVAARFRRLKAKGRLGERLRALTLGAPARF